VHATQTDLVDAEGKEPDLTACAAASSEVNQPINQCADSPGQGLAPPPPNGPLFHLTSPNPPGSYFALILPPVSASPSGRRQLWPQSKKKLDRA